VAEFSFELPVVERVGSLRQRSPGRLLDARPAESPIAEYTPAAVTDTFLVVRVPRQGKFLSGQRTIGRWPLRNPSF
jgi:hypothetical protein